MRRNEITFHSCFFLSFYTNFINNISRTKVNWKEDKLGQPFPIFNLGVSRWFFWLRGQITTTSTSEIETQIASGGNFYLLFFSLLYWVSTARSSWASAPPFVYQLRLMMKTRCLRFKRDKPSKLYSIFWDTIIFVFCHNMQKIRLTREREREKRFIYLIL